MEDEVWTTQDGQVIKVCDMGEGHVRSTLRMVLRKLGRWDEAQEVFELSDRVARAKLCRYIQERNEERAILEENRFNALG